MRGKIAIVVMLTLAVAAAGFGWLWNYQRSVRAREFWGAKAATISQAESVEAFKVTASNSTYGMERTVDLSQSPGLIHARTAGLMGDEAFDWSAPPEPLSAASRWSAGVRFRRGNDTATILFDFTARRIALIETSKTAVLSEKSATGWQDYLERRAFPSDAISRP